MEKYTQRELKRLVAIGAAKDATNTGIPEPYDRIGYSCGVYGLNGGLAKGTETGTLYAITCRNTNLARYF